MKSLKYIIAALLISGPAFADKVGNGGDVFDMGVTTGMQFFDYIEYGQSFDPTKLPEFAAVEAQLKILDQKTPSVAEALRFLLSSSLWAFVVPDLKEVPTTGNTDLIITYKKIQAAVSRPENAAVQINRTVWDSLPVASRSFLLLHELLWLAERSPLLYQAVNPRLRFLDLDLSKPQPWLVVQGGNLDSAYGVVATNDISTTSQTIRRLTGYLMNPALSNPDVMTFEIAAFLMTSVGQVNQNVRFESPETSVGPMKVPLISNGTEPSIGWIYKMEKEYFSILTTMKIATSGLTPLGYFAAVDKEKMPIKEKRKTDLLNAYKEASKDMAFTALRRRIQSSPPLVEKDLSRLVSKKGQNIECYQTWIDDEPELTSNTRTYQLVVRISEWGERVLSIIANAKVWVSFPIIAGQVELGGRIDNSLIMSVRRGADGEILLEMLQEKAVPLLSPATPGVSTALDAFGYARCVNKK